MVSRDDWRLRDQEGYLKGVELTWKNWIRPKPSWDHDHCEFCWETFSDIKEADHLREGYTTKDSSYWICRQCFEDFQEIFDWK